MTTILEPFQLGKLTLKNRIIFATTSLGLKEKEELAFYQEIAKGDVAMIIVGDVPVGKSHSSME